MKVGFIRLENMGRAVARNIQRTGFDLTVHDLRKDAAKTLIEHGARWADTPADTLNQVDLVVTMSLAQKKSSKLCAANVAFYQAIARARAGLIPPPAARY